MDRTKYIIVFQDITKANPEWGEWGNFYKGYLVSDNLISAELMAKLVKGAVVGAIDDNGDECYFENDMESAVRENVHPLNSTISNHDVQLRKRKN